MGYNLRALRKAEKDLINKITCLNDIAEELQNELNNVRKKISWEVNDRKRSSEI